MGKYSATDITTAEWYRHVKTWKQENYLEATASIEPEVAGAGSAGTWDITINLAGFSLQPGDHLAIELPVTWTLDCGRPYIYGRKIYSKNWNPGYSATPKFISPGNIRVEMDFSSDSMGRYFIIDMVIVEGMIESGKKFTVQLANPEGSLIRCQHYAQVTEIPVAVRKKGTKFYRRLKEIPQLKVIGNDPKIWKVVTTPTGKDEFIAKIIAADLENMNPCSIDEPPQLIPNKNISSGKVTRHVGYEGAPVWKVKGKKKTNGNNISLEVLNSRSGLYGQSAPVQNGFIPDMNIYFGDLHGQSNRSIGYGTEEEYFQWAKDAELLDFTAPANHYGGRERATQKILNDTYDLCDRFNKPGEFVTFYSYEWGGLSAHRNVYYRDQRGKLFCGKHKKYSRVEVLWNELEKQNMPVLTIPHHVKFIGRINWKEYNPKYQKLVEICSCWGNSEAYGRHSVQHGLEMGHRLGFVGGTDTHFSQPGRSAFGPFDFGGLTACVATELTRENLWDALAARRCYATTGEKILLDFTINGHLMGSELPLTEKRDIHISVVGAGKIKSIEIIRNNSVWEKIPCNETTFAENITDNQPVKNLLLIPQVGEKRKFIFYYIRVTQENGHQAFSSPIWFVDSKN
jgi:Protein of unknown function (DUF3604)